MSIKDKGGSAQNKRANSFDISKEFALLFCAGRENRTLTSCDTRF